MNTADKRQNPSRILFFFGLVGGPGFFRSSPGSSGCGRPWSRSAWAQEKPPEGGLSRWVRCGLAGAEHVTAIAHVIVRHEQLTGKGLEVKKAGDALGNIVKHAKLIGKVLGKLFLAVPVAAVTLAEIREIRIAVTRDIQKRPEGLLLVIIEVSVLENALECVLIEAALTVPLIGNENLFKMRTFYINNCFTDEYC